MPGIDQLACPFAFSIKLGRKRNAKRRRDEREIIARDWRQYAQGDGASVEQDQAPRFLPLGLIEIHPGIALRYEGLGEREPVVGKGRCYLWRGRQSFAATRAKSRKHNESGRSLSHSRHSPVHC